MATKETGTRRGSPTQIFDCDSVPIAPGTKSRARLSRGLGDGTLPRQLWWLIGGAVAFALAIGVVIGLFLHS